VTKPISDFIEAISNHLSWGVPVLVAGGVWKLFAFIDSYAKADTREHLAAYIRGKVYRSQFLALPALASLILTRLFGERHWTLKCLLRSSLLSICSIFALFSFSLLYNRHDTITVWNWLLALPRKPTMEIGAAWLVWAIVPDYVSLFKTRVVLSVLEKFDLSLRSLLAVAFIDFFIGAMVFLTSACLFTASLSMVYASHLGKLPHSGAWSLVMSDLLLATIALGASVGFTGFNGILFTNIPLGDFFWASMVPSVWLWGYILAVLSARLLFSFAWMLDKVSLLLSVDDHPFKAVGLVAATVAGVTMFVIELGRWMVH